VPARGRFRPKRAVGAGLVPALGAGSAPIPGTHEGCPYFFNLRAQFFLAPHHGIEPLDGGDADLADGIELVRFEKLHIVKLGEFAMFSIRFVKRVSIPVLW